jgi:hypothetical protein
MMPSGLGAFVIITVAVLSLPAARAGQSSPLQIYDEMILAAVLLDKCHFKFDGKISKERLAAIGKAAFSQLWVELNDQNPGNLTEMVGGQIFLLKKRTEELVSLTYPNLLAQEGCATLENRARNAVSPIQE